MNALTVNDRRSLSLWLAMWAMGSMIVALMTLVVQASIPLGRMRWFVQSFAAECLFWGLIEVAFAFAGLYAARLAAQAGSSPHPERIVRLLRFIIRVDIAILVLAAILLIYGVSIGDRASGRPGATLAGHAVAIALQCGFLMLLCRHFLRRFTIHTTPAAIE